MGEKRQIGLDGILYVDGIEVKNCRDLTWSDEWNESDASSRESKIELSQSTLRKAEISFQMNATEADAAYTAIRAAFVSKKEVAVIVKGKSTESADADLALCNWQVRKFSKAQGLKDVQYTDVVLKPSSAV